MDELIQKVAEKTGLDHEKAKAAVDTVLAHLKEHMTPETLSKVAGFLGEHGGNLFGGAIDNVKERFGGLFGKKD